MSKKERTSVVKGTESSGGMTRYRKDWLDKWSQKETPTSRMVEFVTTVGMNSRWQEPDVSGVSHSKLNELNGKRVKVVVTEIPE